jgi:hypothetical protein
MRANALDILFQRANIVALRVSKILPIAPFLAPRVRQRKLRPRAERGAVRSRR